MVRPQVHSRKHIIQTSITPIVAGAKQDIVLAEGTVSGSVTGLDDVREGATLKACYVEHWIRSSELSPGSFVFVLYKIPGGADGFSVGEMAALGGVVNKKNIFFTSQGLTNDADADAVAVMRGWYKVPKSKQRFGLGDKLQITIFANGGIDLVTCGVSIYKEYW